MRQPLEEDCGEGRAGRTVTGVVLQKLVEDKGLGVGFIPALAWRCIDDLVPVKLRIIEPQCQRTIGVAWHEDHYLSAAARRFRQFLIDYLPHLEREVAFDRDENTPSDGAST